MTHAGHLTNWSILVAVVVGFALCWLRRDHHITRLSRRCRHFERQWRMSRDTVERVVVSIAALRAENEHLTDDLANAVREAQVVREQLGYVSEQLAQRINHPSQRRDAELFERLEKDFS